MATLSGSAALRNKIETLAGQSDESSLELAEALADARALPRASKGGHPDFDELAKLTKRSRRTVIYLTSIWKRFGDLKIARDRLARLGWTKLAIIAEHGLTDERLQ